MGDLALPRAPRATFVPSILAAIAMAAVGCGGSGGSDDSPDPASGAGELTHYGSQAATQLRLTEEFTGDLGEMVERRHIRALVAYGKTSYFLDGLRQRGVAYDLLKQFEELVNERYGGDVPILVIPIPATRAEMIEGLRAGRGDLALGALTVTPERAAVVDFSDPLMSGVAEIAVTGPAAEPLGAVDDLAGRTVYVRPSSSYFASLQTLNEDFESRGLEPVQLIEAEEYLEDEDLLEMVDAGIVETIIVDQYKAEFWDQIFDNITVHPDVAVRADGAIAWAFRQGSPELTALVNEFVRDHRKGTLMGNMVFNRYLRDTEYVENILEDDSAARFRDTVHYFEEYAPQYDFDHLMMVAQGYQESRLDQSLVSRRGAVGIMQLLPSTAADDSVGIPDIESAENNIHAGIRYMRWIRDTYFGDPDLDPVNATLMSFASYNAGPNRIRRLREETAARGLDPNRWFRNVELLVAEDIGRETVGYVEKIYKYYAAYRLMLEREQLRAQAR